jgi:hypothetical protein
MSIFFAIFNSRPSPLAGMAAGRMLRAKTRETLFGVGRPGIAGSSGFHPLVHIFMDASTGEVRRRDQTRVG